MSTQLQQQHTLIGNLDESCRRAVGWATSETGTGEHEALARIRSVLGDYTTLIDDLLKEDDQS